MTKIRIALALLVCICICTGLTGVALAQCVTNPVPLPSVTCPSNLMSCTANDVTTTILSVNIMNVCYHNGVSMNVTCTTNADCAAGDTCAPDVCESTSDNIFIQITTAYASTSAQRYDLGLFVSDDGGTVQEPSTALVCSGAAAQVGQGNSNCYSDPDTDLFLDLDPSGHSSTPSTPDTCGDLDATFGPVNWTVNVSVKCAIDSNNNLVIPACRVWEQNPNHKVSCQTIQQAGTGSKCDCTPLTVTPQINPCATKVCNDNDICTLDSCQVQNGQAVCVFTPGNAGTVCRDSAGVCDAVDTCDGVHAGCADQKKPSTTICRPSAGQCDVAESCTGTSNDCPADGFQPATTTCTGTSNGGACDGTDSCDGAGHCVDGFKPSTTICRASTGPCDVAESCTGTSGACPPDGFKPSGTACGDPSSGQCDNPDTCDGSGNCQSNHAADGTNCGDAGSACTNQDTCLGGVCHDNGFKPSTTVCRPSTGQCDVAETCTGTSGVCPPDGFQPSTTTCTGTSNGGACDGTDSCDGAGHCVDGFKPSTTVCRPSTGQCDVAESCTGTSGACPPDRFQPSTTTCTGTSNGGVCDGTDSCDGAGHCVDGFKPSTTVCRPSTGSCDIAESCTGSSGSCPPDTTNPTCTQITPTQVSCSLFSSGKAPDEVSGGYNTKTNIVNSVNPGVMFYYTHMTAPSSGILTFTQTNASQTCSAASWKAMPPQATSQVVVYSAGCGTLSSSSTYNATTGTITTTLSGVAPGTPIIVGIKYQPGSLTGQAVTRTCHPQENYVFSDSGGGTDSIFFVPKN